MAVVDKNLESQLKELSISYTLFDEFYNDTTNPAEAVDISIVDFSNGFDMFSFKLPKKKEVNFDWVMNKLNADRTFQNFTDSFKKLLTVKGYNNSINVYPTSYGIGVFVMFGYRDSISTIKADIESVLAEYGIEYTEGVSDAGWVFRYKISKSKENISRIEKVNS